MKPNAYRDVMTERWVADMCAYPPCENSPRRPYNAEQPIVSLYNQMLLQFLFDRLVMTT